MLLRCAKKCFRRVQFSFCEAKLFMMAANEQIKSAVCLPKNKQLADFFLLCEMETERIAISSLAYAIFRMDVFRPAGISAKACVCCIQDQPGSCRMLRKFFLICGFSIFCHRIWKRTEMEIITAYNLNGMCSHLKERQIAYPHGHRIRTVLQTERAVLLQKMYKVQSVLRLFGLHTSPRDLFHTS